MSGTLTFVGSKTLGECVPIAAIAQASLTAAASLSLPEIQGKLKGLVNVSLALSVRPPSLALQVEAALKVVGQLQALLTVQGPVASLQLSGALSLIAELQISLGQIEGFISLAARLGIQLGTPGLEVYRYDGDAGSLPDSVRPEFASGMRIGGGPGMPIHGILIVATDAGAWAVLQSALAAA